MKDIISMIDNDLSVLDGDQGQEQQDNDINYLVANAMSAKELDDEDIVGRLLAMTELHNFLIRPGNLIKIFDCKQTDEMGEALTMICQLPWVKGTSLENLYIECAYSVIYRHFEYGNELEKGFAALLMQHVIQNFEDQLTPCIDDFKAEASTDPVLIDRLDKDDMRQEPIYLILQISYAMVSYIKHLYKMFPMMEHESVLEYCQGLDDFFIPLEISHRNILIKADLLNQFIIENRIKQFEGEEE